MIVDIQAYHSTQQIMDIGLRPDDFYQTYAYCRTDAVFEQSTPLLITCTHDAHVVVIPVQQRNIPDKLNGADTWHDGFSPYGYSGILTNCENQQILMDMLDAIRVALGDAGIISLFLRLHPIHHKFTLPAHPHITHLQHGKVVYVDLREDIDMIRRNYSNNHRYDIRKLYRNGYSVRMDDWSMYPQFQEAYYATMHMHQAGKQYLFDQAYFNSLRDPEIQMHLFSTHDAQGAFASGALFMSYGKTVQYHLGGTMPAFRNASPAKIIFDQAFAYFKELGFTYFHLGGGFGSAQDNLYKFKERFSSKTTHFSTIRMICAPGQYQKLADEHLRTTGISASNYFPLYRAT